MAQASTQRQGEPLCLTIRAADAATCSTCASACRTARPAALLAGVIFVNAEGDEAHEHPVFLG
jgi:hypothetical protein